MVDIFRNPTSSVPRSDKQIVRVNMQELELGGRKTALPKSDPGATELAIKHVSTSR